MPQDMNPDQVRNILKFIDETQSEPVKQSVFTQLGHDCFYTRKLDQWIGQYTGNVQALLDWINVEKGSTYWERLEFNADRSMLTLTGKVVEECACVFAGCADPPLSLCRYCCKNFQQELFEVLLGQPVEVTISEGFLLGDDRCSTTIHLIE